MRLVAALSVAALAAACGGSSEDPRDPVIGENPLCDPVAQSGCAAGWRCTTITLASGTATAGCVPAGTVAAGGACTFGPDGATTGFDDCRAGLVCAGGTCVSACTLATDAGCSAAEQCTRYSGVFAEGGAYGACTPTCDPLTQERLTDGAVACGSLDPGAPSLGCYGAPSSSAQASRFTCASVAAPDLTHRQPALGPAPGSAYLNGCAPGYLPLLRESTDSSVMVCIALCAPVESYQGASALRQGASPFSCPDAGATGTGEECRFWWLLEGPDTPVSALTSGLGFCFDHTLYTYDDDGNAGTPAVPMPSCADLSSTDTDGDGIPDHLYWGCGPKPTI